LGKPATGLLSAASAAPIALRLDEPQRIAAEIAKLLELECEASELLACCTVSDL
jgi:hypothetical protein